MLSISAFNAFLKTLEEPPKHVIFILATTEENIKFYPPSSRDAKFFEFKRITPLDVQHYLSEIAQNKGSI